MHSLYGFHKLLKNTISNGEREVGKTTLEMSPRIELQMLILRGGSIQNRLNAWKESIRGLKSRAKTDIELESRLWGGIADLIVEDIGPLARNFAKAYRIAQAIQKLQNEETDIRIVFDAWRKEAENFLAKVSVKRKNLKSPGNSQTLIKRFSRSNDYVKLETRIRHAIIELGKIAREDLIFNTELPLMESKESLLEPERPFSAQKVLRDILADANQYVKILDPWVNDHSLDPLLHVKNGVKVQFLCSQTGGRKKEHRLIRSIRDLKVEKPMFSLRKAKREEMHDRWIITDKGIWSLSQSIKDLGRKQTIAFVAPHSEQIKKSVSSFFDRLWGKAIEIIA